MQIQFKKQLKTKEECLKKLGEIFDIVFLNNLLVLAEKTNKIFIEKKAFDYIKNYLKW